MVSHTYSAAHTGVWVSISDCFTQIQYSAHRCLSFYLRWFQMGPKAPAECYSTCGAGVQAEAGWAFLRGGGHGSLGFPRSLALPGPLSPLLSRHVVPQHLLHCLLELLAAVPRHLHVGPNTHKSQRHRLCVCARVYVPVCRLARVCVCVGVCHPDCKQCSLNKYDIDNITRTRVNSLTALFSLTLKPACTMLDVDLNSSLVRIKYQMNTM